MPYVFICIFKRYTLFWQEHSGCYWWSLEGDEIVHTWLQCSHCTSGISCIPGVSTYKGNYRVLKLGYHMPWAWSVVTGNYPLLGESSMSHENLISHCVRLDHPHHLRSAVLKASGGHEDPYYPQMTNAVSPIFICNRKNLNINESLLYNTGNYIEYTVINHKGKGI